MVSADQSVEADAGGNSQSSSVSSRNYVSLIDANRTRDGQQNIGAVYRLVSVLAKAQSLTFYPFGTFVGAAFISSTCAAP